MKQNTGTSVQNPKYIDYVNRFQPGAQSIESSVINNKYRDIKTLEENNDYQYDMNNDTLGGIHDDANPTIFK